MIIENQKMIKTPAEVVWDIIQDVEGWPRWAPTMTHIVRLDDGPFQMGSLARIKQPGLPPCQWRVTEYTAGSGFTWETRVLGISMSATHFIMASDSETKSVLQLRLAGILVYLLWPVIVLSVKKNLERENSALKTVCESGAD